MLDREIHESFKALNDQLPNERSLEKISKTIERASRTVCLGWIPINIIDDEDRRVMKYYQKWLSIQLINILIRDKDRIVVTLKEFQLQLLNQLFWYQRWLFGDIIQFFSSLLKKGLDFNGNMNQTFLLFDPASEKYESSSPVRLTHSELWLRSNQDYLQVVDHCVSLASSLIGLFIEVQSLEAHRLKNIVDEIFTKKTLPFKSISMEFYTKFYENLLEFKSEDKIALLSTFQSISFDVLQLQVTSQTELVQKKFLENVCKFFKVLKERKLVFEDYSQLAGVVTFCRDILTNFTQLKYRETDLDDEIILMLANSLDRVEMNEIVVVENLKHFEESESAMVLNLLKFPIVFEISKSRSSSKNLIEISPTWRKVHEVFVKHLDKFSNQASQTFVVGCLTLAVQVDFKLTQIHQIHHTSKVLTNVCQFSGLRDCNWKQKLVVDFFPSLDDVVNKLLNHFNASRNENLDFNCAVTLFSLILQICDHENIDKKLENTLIAILSSPFYSVIRNLEIAKFLPEEFKSFFDKHAFSKQDLAEMKADSIAHLCRNQIRYKSTDGFLMKIFQDFISTASQEMKNSFFKDFINFIINNPDESLMSLKDCEKILQLDSKMCKELICLSSSSNLEIIKENSISTEMTVKFHILCRDCSLSTDSCSLIKSHSGIIIPLDEICKFWKNSNIQTLIIQKLNHNEFDKIHKLIVHSENYQTSIRQDHGKKLMEFMISDDEETLELLERDFSKIITSLKECIIRPKDQEIMLKNCYDRLFQLASKCAFRGPDSMQQKVLNLLKILALKLETSDEANIAHCFRLLLYFIIPEGSQIKGPACLAALEMSKKHRFKFDEIFKRSKTFMFSKVTQMLIHNFAVFKVSLLTSVADMRQRLNLPRSSEFFSQYLDIIVAFTIPEAIKSKLLMQKLAELCKGNNETIAEVLKGNFIEIYHEIYSYTKDQPELFKKCQSFIEQDLKISISAEFQENAQSSVEQALVYFKKSPDFVINIISDIIHDSDTEKIADDIDSRLLGVLISFENHFASDNCERPMKRLILHSIGDIISFLDSQRISKHCFKIATILNTATESDLMDVKEICIKVWDKLIRICDVASIGQILSTVCVSLEDFIDEFPDEVHKIMDYLVMENSNLLSRNICDLFFIEKTKFNQNLKECVMTQMRSQKMKDFANFRNSLKTLIRHLNNEKSGIKIKVHCLQYLKTEMMKNRDELNKMISGQLSMDSLIEELLISLVRNSKNSNKNLRLALSQCLGELGAIEPNLQQQNYSSQTTCPPNALSQEFAVEAMKVLCRSYQHKNESKFVDAISLAIQKIFNQHEIKSRNSYDEIWKSVPESLQHLIGPLMTSQYKPKQKKGKLDEIIFWQKEKTLNGWIVALTSGLINNIKDREVKTFLEYLVPSMKSNEHTTSLFLPYIVLHSIKYGGTIYDDLKREFEYIFNIVLSERTSRGIEIKQERTSFSMKMYHYEPVLYSKSTDLHMNSLAFKVSKLIFEIFDFLENYRRSINSSQESSDESDSSEYEDSIYLLLSKFEPELLGRINFECGEYARAMIYMENALKIQLRDTENINEDQRKLTYHNLAKTYAKLDNVDAVKGVLELSPYEWDVRSKLSINNFIGDFQNTASCFEILMKNGQCYLSIEDVRDITNSHIALDRPGMALMVYEEMIKKVEEQNSKICAEIRAEPLWRLSRFDELEKMMDKNVTTTSSNWGIQCANLLVNFRKDDEDNFSKILAEVRIALMSNLKITGNEQTAYEKNYREFVNLHLITDIEKAEMLMSKIKNFTLDSEAVDAFKMFISEQNSRYEIIQKNPRIEEPILCFNRVLLDVMDKRIKKLRLEPDSSELSNVSYFITEEIQRLWIKSIKIANKNKMYGQAQAFILNAQEGEELFIQKAKLQWVQGDRENALKTLHIGTKSLQNLRCSNEKRAKLMSEAKLLTARYNADAMNFDVETIKKMFHEANIKGAENEKVFLLTADYMDRYYSVQNETQIAQVGRPDQMYEVMKTYYSSLCLGNDFIFQSMPRFLSIWLDMTANHKNNDYVKEMSRLADRAATTFSSTYFYTSFSQILSRICHQSNDVYPVLKKIVSNIVEKHPQQALWFLIPMLRSLNTGVKTRVKDILSSSKQQDIIRQFNLLIDHFNRLATLKVEKTHSFDLNHYSEDLMKFLRNKKTEFILPFEFNLQMNRVGSSFKFQDNLVYIHKLDPKVVVMTSMQKPKKVVIIGSDGKSYPCLFKTQDDLRIDLRFMQVSSVLKGFLLKDPESRQRQLTTRTYSVVPLNEKAGIIEWVPNLQTYKQIITNEYRKKNFKVPLLNHYKNICNLPKNQQVLKYRSLIKEDFPAELGNYYRCHFPSPQNYYKARLAYIKSTAAWSIIGYIMGLGDRHGENILIDVCTGETFHVDCNMLFNRGESLSVPEVVPFRMTQNMIDAMGVLGIEGPFRKSCEIILRVLQKEKNTLLAYLRPIIYDITAKNQNEKGEVIEREAVRNYKNVEARLCGYATKFRSKSHVPLSVEGHVSYIINEATNEENLAGMFCGWMPWM